MHGTDSRRAFEALPLEARIRLVVSELLGWEYPAPSVTPRVPDRPPHTPRELRVSVGPTEERIDCSTLTAYVLLSACLSARWDRDSYGDLQTFQGRGPWASLDAVERSGAGERRDEPQRGRWHLAQSWRDPARLQGGHARLVRDDGRDGILVLESTTRDDDRDGVRDGPRWTRTTWDALPGETRVAVLRP